MADDTLKKEDAVAMIQPFGSTLTFLQSAAIVEDHHGRHQNAHAFRDAYEVIRLQTKEIARLTDLELRWRDIVASTTRSKPLGGFIWRWLHDRGVT